MTVPLNAFTRPRMRITTSREVPVSCISETNHGKEYRKNGVEGNDKEDRLHHRARRQLAHARSVALDSQSFETAYQRYYEGEDGRLDETDEQRPQRDGALQLAHEGRESNSEIEIGHHHATDETHHICVKGQQRQRDHEPEHARQHQIFGDVETDGLHRIGLLVHAHRSDRGGEGRSRTTSDNDRSDESAKLTQETDTEEIDGINLRAETLQLVRALIGKHDAEQKGEHADNGKCSDARLFDLLDESRKGQFAPRRENGFPGLYRNPSEKPHQIIRLVQHVHGAAADALE